MLLPVREPPGGSEKGPHRRSIAPTDGALVKISVDQDQRSHKSPHVQGNADPTGADLHPHRWPPAGHLLIVGVRAAVKEEDIQ